MPPTLSDSLSETLHAFLAARAVEERNKELARALVAAGNRGEPNQLTRHWARPGCAWTARACSPTATGSPCGSPPCSRTRPGAWRASCASTRPAGSWSTTMSWPRRSRRAERATRTAAGCAPLTGDGDVAVLFADWRGRGLPLARALYGTFPVFRREFDTAGRALQALLPLPLAAVVFAPAAAPTPGCCTPPVRPPRPVRLPARPVPAVAGVGTAGRRGHRRRHRHGHGGARRRSAGPRHGRPARGPRGTRRGRGRTRLRPTRLAHAAALRPDSGRCGRGRTGARTAPGLRGTASARAAPRLGGHVAGRRGPWTGPGERTGRRAREPVGGG